MTPTLEYAGVVWITHSRTGLINEGVQREGTYLMGFELQRKTKDLEVMADKEDFVIFYKTGTRKHGKK